MRPPPKLLGDRSVNPEWLAAVTGDVLSQWVFDLLHEQDLDLPPWVNDTPHRLLIAAYKAAPEGARKVLRDAVAEYVLQMADGDDRVWRGLPGDRLVFVAGEMCGKDVAGTLRRMVSSGAFVDLSAPIPGDVHGRMLQALVKLGVRESLEFWLGQARLCPARYLPVAMRGVEISELNPFRLLALVDTTWDDELLADIEMVVDLLDMARGSEWVAQAIRECRDSIPAEVLRVLPEGEGGPDALGTPIYTVEVLPDTEGKAIVVLWQDTPSPAERADAVAKLRAELGPALARGLPLTAGPQRTGTQG